MPVVTDQTVSPTLSSNLADMLLEVAEHHVTGKIHLAGQGRITRYEFATSIARAFNLNPTLILERKSSEIPWKAQRPRDSSLNVEKALRTLRSKPLTIAESIETFKREVEAHMQQRPQHRSSREKGEAGE